MSQQQNVSTKSYPNPLSGFTDEWVRRRGYVDLFATFAASTTHQALRVWYILVKASTSCNTLIERWMLTKLGVIFPCCKWLWSSLENVKTPSSGNITRDQNYFGVKVSQYLSISDFLKEEVVLNPKVEFRIIIPLLATYCPQE